MNLALPDALNPVEPEHGVLVRMQLSLPRDARYVALMRQVASCVMSDFGVPTEAIDDIQLAVTEACGNAVRHATGVAEYSVRLGVGVEACEVDVIDMGPGFDPPPLTSPTHADFETGRGLYLIQALVDDLQFIREDHATHVRLVKRWPGVKLPEPAPSDS